MPSIFFLNFNFYWLSTEFYYDVMVGMVFDLKFACFSICIHLEANTS